MDDPITFGIFCFVSLFAMVEPVGALPVYLAMTADLTIPQQRSVAKRATLIAYITLLVVAFTGQFVFRFFGISVHSLKVVGGIIFFLIGYEMLQARLSRTNYDEESTTEYSNDIALTPLGIPLICGPGAMANTIVLWNEASTFMKRTAMLVAITAVMLVTLAVLLGGRSLARFLGESGNKVILRLMGLITMVIAVDFFFDGLKPIVRDILMIQAPAAPVEVPAKAP
jgi:multiple antibiotic resistance protein